MPKTTYDRVLIDNYDSPVYGLNHKRRREREDRALVSFITFILICALALAATFAMKAYIDKTSKPKLYADAKARYAPIATTVTNTGTIEWFELVDPDTKVTYLISDQGACTPRLDAKGNLMIGDEQE